MDKAMELLTDIIKHRAEVQENISMICRRLEARGMAHDLSKFGEIEFDAFLSTRERFKKANYGTPEYDECVKAIQPAIDHHYAYNLHHTKHWPNGINNMSLIDIVEMVADWRAAERRSPDRTLKDTMEDAFKKYKIEGQLKQAIINTMEALRWIQK